MGFFDRIVAWRRKTNEVCPRAEQSESIDRIGDRQSKRFGGRRPPLQGGALGAGFEAVADPIGEAANEFSSESGGPGGVDAGGAEDGLNHGKGLERLEGTEGGLRGLAVVPDFEEAARGRLGG